MKKRMALLRLAMAGALVLFLVVLSTSVLAQVQNTYYSIVSKVSVKCLDVKDGDTSDGANVWQWPYNGTGAQLWWLTISSIDDYYSLFSKKSGKCLDVESGNTAEGANVQQYTCNGTDAQLWKLECNDNGYCSIIAKNSGMCLAVENGDITEGANVQQHTCNGTDAQLWKLIAKGDVDANGELGLSDVIAALKASVGMDVDAFQNADVNGDRKIGMEETIYTLWKVAGLMSPEKELAIKYAPVVYMHPDEKYFPTEVNYYLANVNMLYDPGDISAQSTILYEVNSENITEQEYYVDSETTYYSDDNDKFSLTHENNRIKKGQEDFQIPCYAFYKEYPDENYDEINYWFFYAHNGNIGISSPDLSSHEGDWEHISVKLDHTTKAMLGAYYAAHEHEGEWFHASELSFANETHPEVFSAKYSHASYNWLPAYYPESRPGELEIPRTIIEGITVEVVEAPDHIASKTRDGVKKWETFKNIQLFSANQPNWVNYKGRWGKTEEGISLFGMTYKPKGPTGPHGPSDNVEDFNNTIKFYSKDNFIGGFFEEYGGPVKGLKWKNLTEPVLNINYNFKEEATRPIFWDGDGDERCCDELINDEIRSLKITGFSKGTKISLYDSPTSETDDDYMKIFIKRDMFHIGTNVYVNIATADLYNDTIDAVIIKRHKNGLSGKVSNIKIERPVDVPDGFVAFYSGNDCKEDDLLGVLDMVGSRSYDISDGSPLPNDEVRSAKLLGVPKDATIEVYDNSEKDKDDDWTRVHVKKDISEYCIDSFEKDKEDSSITMDYQYAGCGTIYIPPCQPLDGKISNIVINAP